MCVCIHAYIYMNYTRPTNKKNMDKKGINLYKIVSTAFPQVSFCHVMREWKHLLCIFWMLEMAIGR